VYNSQKKGQPLELKDIKDLMNAMRRSFTKKLRIKQGDFELELEREDKEEQIGVLEQSPSRDEFLKLREDRALSQGSPLKPPEVEKNPQQESVVYVTSPMVGTFYSFPSPEDPPFVKPGDLIKNETIVCIIEAMKVMNEVKASVSGSLLECLVENGHPVEFGTKLFRVKLPS
jgi:acetyl-CoA carboxylase biotin carboxyl carrier protein